MKVIEVAIGGGERKMSSPEEEKEAEMLVSLGVMEKKLDGDGVAEPKKGAKGVEGENREEEEEKSIAVVVEEEIGGMEVLKSKEDAVEVEAKGVGGKTREEKEETLTAEGDGRRGRVVGLGEGEAVGETSDLALEEPGESRTKGVEAEIRVITGTVGRAVVIGGLDFGGETTVVVDGGGRGAGGVGEGRSSSGSAETLKVGGCLRHKEEGEEEARVSNSLGEKKVVGLMYSYFY